MSKCVGALFISVAAFARGSAARAQSVERMTKVDTRISSDLAVDALYPFETHPRMQAAVRGASRRRVATKGLRWVEAFTRKSETLRHRSRLSCGSNLKRVHWILLVGSARKPITGATPAVLRPTCRAPRSHAHLDALATNTQYAHATLMR